MERPRILLIAATAVLTFGGPMCDSGAPPEDPVDIASDATLPLTDVAPDAAPLPVDASIDTATDLFEDIPDALGDLEDAGPPDGGHGDVETGGCIDVYPGQVLITEIMRSPLQAPAPAGQWIELFNAGGEDLKMNGWELCDAGGACVDLALPVGASFVSGGALVLGFEAAVADNGGVEIDRLVEGVDLATGALSLRVPATGLQVDAVDWSAGGWPDAAGASMSLGVAHYDLLQNDDPASWCAATQSYGYGDQGTPGAMNNACEVAPICGDGVADEGEDCDDGKNGDPDDGCRDDCSFTCAVPAADCTDVSGDCGAPVCAAGGLGQICAVQPADDPPQDGNPCTAKACADGIPSIVPLPGGSACDNGGGSAGDYCVAMACVEADCGDGIEGPLEACDDGDNEPGDGCSPDCGLEECGNAILDPLEDCDDGQDGDNEDGCRDDCGFTCQIPLADCPSAPGDCAAPVCILAGAGQLCDAIADGSDPPSDGNPCTQDLCQGGVPAHPPEADGAPCDNGAGKVGDYCADGVCLDPVCGDGITGSLEGCDDQNQDPCDGCHADCTLLALTCGDGFTCGDEGCDDQDGDECDGCLSDCTLHDNVCGDGILCAPEECDDGELEGGDGCSAQCLEENEQPCPPDMVHVPAAPTQGVAAAFCMDLYEASRQDATALSMGTNTAIAVSTAGVLPWYENPIDEIKFQAFQAACEAAGKRLCEAHEWFHSCAGTAGSVYLWGDVFDPEVCNTVDTWCDDYCQEHGIDPCVETENCGYALYYQHPQFGQPFHPVPTGAMTECANEFGAYDVAGNVWEVVPDDPATSPIGKPFQIRGGAYNCGSPSVRLQCTFEANWTSLYAGFRCCRDPD